MEYVSFRTTLTRNFEEVISESKKTEQVGNTGETSFETRILQSLSIYFYYIIFCCGWGLVASCFPYLVAKTGSNEISNAFFFRAIGGIVGATVELPLLKFFSRRMSDYGGLNLKMVLTILLLASGQFVLPLSSNIYLTLFCVSIEGFVFGLSLCAMTIYLRYIWGGKTVAPILHALHVMNGVAGTLYPIFCTIVFRSEHLSDDWKLRIPYFTQVGLLCISACPFMLYQIHETIEVDVIDKKREEESEKTMKKRMLWFCKENIFSLKSLLLLGIAASIFFGQACHLMNMGALSTYIISSGLANESEAVLYYSAFYSSVMILRLLLVPLANCFKSIQIVLIAYAFGSWSCLLIWFFGKHSQIALWIGVIFQGLCSSPTFSPYFVLSIEEFGWRVPNEWVTIFSYVVFICWFTPSVSIWLIQSVHPNVFIFLLLFCYMFSFGWNLFVVFGGNGLYCLTRRHKKRKKRRMRKISINLIDL